MDILNVAAVELQCLACGEHYEITLRQILLSEELLHKGCPVAIERTTECPPLYFAHLAECGLIQELKQIWFSLEEIAESGGGKLILRGAQKPVSSGSRVGEM